MLDFVSSDKINGKIEYEYIQTNIDIPIKIVQVSLSCNEERIYVPMHCHQSIEFVVPKMNLLKFWIEDVIYEVSPDQVLLTNSKELHSCKKVNETEEYLGYVVHMDNAFIESIIENSKEYYFDSFYDNDKELLDILNELIGVYYSEDNLKNIQIRGLSYKLIYYLLKNHSHKYNYKISYSDKQKENLSQIIDYLIKNSDDNVNVQALAQHFHLSYGYVADLFKEVLHMTVHDTLNLIRIKKIENDLIMTNKSITEICLSHGFNNTKSFYRVFKKYTRMTPREYRNIDRKI